MKRARVTPEAACAWLKEHLEELDQFRNASTRDPRFKQWRQSTLTVIQRIWPGVTARSSRFRRIPFSPPSTLADARQTREAFERGCAEATLIVRGWMAEIESSGIRLENPDVQEAVADELVYGAPALMLDGEIPDGNSGEDALDPGVPTIDLPRSEPASETVVSAPARGGVSRTTTRSKVAAAGKPAPAKAAMPATAAPNPATENPSKPGKPVTTRTRSAQATPRAGRLKDMLGLAHLSAAAGGPDESRRLESIAEPLAMAPPRPPAAAIEPFIIETVLPAAPPTLELAWPVVAPEASPPSMERLDVADLELTVVEEPPASAPILRAGDLAGAAEIARLAQEVALYDVPATECDRVRSTLLDLAQSIERGDPSWDALRAAMAVVMHYPKLGRRAMPLLLPLLDRTG